MAERRMFAKTIIDSDTFLNMPLSAQALYFHLSMRADDDGFVDNPKNIQRMVGASNDDCALLVMKRFLIAFENGVIVIKHWKIHNYIQKDRYKPTLYQEELAKLHLDSSKIYTDEPQNDAEMRVNEGDVSKMDTQVRLGKVSIDKTIPPYSPSHGVDTEEASKSMFDARFDRFWSVYPKKVGKGDARKAFLKLKPSEDLTVRMIEAVERQKGTEQWQRERGQFIPHPSTWLNQARWEDEGVDTSFISASKQDKSHLDVGALGNSFDSDDFFEAALARSRDVLSGK